MGKHINFVSRLLTRKSVSLQKQQQDIIDPKGVGATSSGNDASLLNELKASADANTQYSCEDGKIYRWRWIDGGWEVVGGPVGDC